MHPTAITGWTGTAPRPDPSVVEHRDPDRALRDLRRQAFLTADGWEVLRFPARDVPGRPRWVAECVRRELLRRGALTA